MTNMNNMWKVNAYLIPVRIVLQEISSEKIHVQWYKFKVALNKSMISIYWLWSKITTLIC